MNINSNSRSNHLVLGRRPSLLVGMDDESSQILGILKRTNTGRRSSSYNNENIMKSGTPFISVQPSLIRKENNSIQNSTQWKIN